MGLIQILKQHITVLRVSQDKYRAKFEGVSFFEADAATADNALDALLSRLKEGLQAEYTPIVYQNKEGIVTVIYREIDGWRYMNFYPDPENTPAKLIHGGWVSPYESLSEVEASVRYSVAQDNWDGQSDVSPLLVNDDEERRGRFARWTRWQLRYREAKAQGKTNNEAHAYASGY